MLCSKCWGMLRGHEGKVWKGTYDLHFHHHDSIHSLQESAALMCGICRVLYQEWNNKEAYSTDTTFEKATIDLQNNPIDKSLVSVNMNPEIADTRDFSGTASLSVVRNVDEHDLFRLDFRLRCGEKTRKRTFVLRQIDDSEAPFHTPASQNTSSSEVFKQAVEWYSKCQCANLRPRWHPTRLIDLRELKTRVQLEGARTVLKGRMDWETLGNEVIRLVDKDDDAFPRAEAALKTDDEDLAHNVEGIDHGKAPRHIRRNHNRYVTLSHCWGDHRPMVLNSSNIDELKRGIRLGDLPTTYKQAIQFAAQIEDVGWIWVDSLCIIQDDAKDWTHESSDMQRVYRESFLNISATAAKDSTGGLYYDRLPKTLWEDEVNLKVDGIQGLARKSTPRGPFDNLASYRESTWAAKKTRPSFLSAILKWFTPAIRKHPVVQEPPQAAEAEGSPDISSFKAKGVRRCILVNVSHWDDLVNTAPVNVRAWVLQERLLAPRVLHFSEGQIAWECSEFEESEGYPAGIPQYILRDDHLLLKPLNKGLLPDIHGKQLRDIRLRGRLDPDAHLDDIHAFELWSRIVEDYSKLNMTECNDKLVALSGLARFAATRVIGSDSKAAVYHAGLWERHLASQLLWKVEPVFEAHSRTFAHPSRRPRNKSGKFIYRAPSFSWASVDAQHGNGVSYGEITDQDLFIEVDTGEDSVSTICKIPRNLYGEVLYGHVMIWGQLRQIKLYKVDKGRFSWRLEGRSGVCPGQQSHELKAEEHRNVYLDCPIDDGDAILEATGVYCVPAALGSRTEDRESKYIICLLLQHIPDNDERLSSLHASDRHGVYRRIGLTKLSTWADKLAYRYIQEPLDTDIDYPQRPHKYGMNGTGRSLIRII